MSVVQPAVVAGGPKRLDVFARYLTLWVVRNEIRARLNAWLVERQPAETMTRRTP
jgi:hypothetical protein